MALSAEAETARSWIPGLTVLARNDGLVVFVIPAKAGIQGKIKGNRVHLFTVPAGVWSAPDKAENL
jgi:hypothetical protein